jgi:manganese/zinc/iron transport system permease protein
MSHFYIILTAIIIGMACSLPGLFLILRKNTMLADSVSHSILPGVVIAYLLFDSRSSFIVNTGAIVFGVVSMMMVNLFQKKANLQSDAAIGVTFTFLFAIGIILISFFAGSVDLDLDCVLFGEIAYVPFKTNHFFGIELPIALVNALVSMMVNVIFIVFAFHQLLISSFNESYAQGLGFKTQLIDFVLLIIVALTCVNAFEAVGTVLVLGFIVLPGATALLITYKMNQLFVWMMLFNIISSLGGYYLAYLFNLSIGSSIIVVLSIIFSVVLAIHHFQRKNKGEAKENSKTYRNSQPKSKFRILFSR